MINFQYSRAGNVADAVSQMAASPGAKFVAGGTNLVDLMKMDVERPVKLIDVNDEKQEIRLEGKVRPIDIAENNTIQSTRIADAKISYMGDGVLGEKQKPGAACSRYSSGATHSGTSISSNGEPRSDDGVPRVLGAERRARSPGVAGEPLAIRRSPRRRRCPVCTSRRIRSA